jgi:8-oxo-dGTP pyrophosphatase MutT (NUDIX family)
MEFDSIRLDDLCTKLERRLEQPLPGKISQMKFASKLRRENMKEEYDISAAVKSAVLILLYPDKGSIQTVFILRPDYGGVHSKQVAFPGGRSENYDRDIIETALREAYEEVNIRQEQVKILGKLSDLYIPPSNYMVTPVIGCSHSRPDFKPDKNEVDEIIETNLSFLFDKKLLKNKIIHVRGYEIDAPYFDINGFVVWGATAMILSELKDTIESINLNAD